MNLAPALLNRKFPIYCILVSDASDMIRPNLYILVGVSNSTYTTDSMAPPFAVSCDSICSNSLNTVAHQVAIH